jgi:hypothetical protein
VQVNEKAELESLVNAQAQKTAKLIAAYAILKLEKEIVMAGCWRLSEKQKMLVDKTEQEKAELAKARATKLVRVKEELDKETQDYTDYRLNMWHRLRDLHGVVASSFGEVKPWCLPFPIQNAKVEELIDWVGEELKVMSDTMWQLNDNFVVLPIEGVLNMLLGAGCQDLS